MSKKKGPLPHVREDREKESFLHVYRLQKGMTVRELCEKTCIDPNEYYKLNSGMLSPLYDYGPKEGTVRSSVVRLCEELGCEFEEAFPRYFCTLQRNTDLIDDQVLDITVGTRDNIDPEINLINKEFTLKLLETIDGIHCFDNSHKIMWLEYYMYDESISSIAKKFNKSNTRTSHIVEEMSNRIKQHFYIKFPNFQFGYDVDVPFNIGFRSKFLYRKREALTS